MYTLGINAAYHDDAACLVKDGRVIAAAEDERFTHVKHGKRPVPFTTWQLPFHAIEYCLREAGIEMKDVDHAPELVHETRLAVGSERHHLVLVGRVQESEVLRDALVEQPQRVRVVHLADALQLVAGADTVGRRGALATPIQRHHSGLRVRRGVEGAGGVRDVMLHEVPAVRLVARGAREALRQPVRYAAGEVPGRVDDR